MQAKKHKVMDTTPKFQNIGIAGLGLIGGSLALEIKKRGIACCVTGFSRRHSTLKKAKSQGIIDRYYMDFDEGLDSLDFLVISTPIRVMNDYFTKIKKHNPLLLVTDVASVKETVVQDAEAILGKNSNFVGSHPLTGSEKSGIGALKENLFEHRFVVITPSQHTKKKNVTRVKNFWKSLGAVPILLSPAEHDRLVALTSHLPHFLVFSLLSVIEKYGKEEPKLFNCVGTGFLDTTRIGKSNPELWAEIFIDNRKNLLFYLEEFEKKISEIKKMLKEREYEKLVTRLGTLKKTREEMDEQRRDI